MATRIVHSTIFVFVAISSKSQSLEVLTSRTSALYKKTAAAIVFPLDGQQYVPMQMLFRPETTRLNAHLIQLKALQSKSLSKDIGLRFSAMSNYYFGIAQVESEEEDNNAKSKIKMELEWNIFKGGLLHNKNKSRQKSFEKKLLELEKERNNKALFRKKFQSNYTFSINKELMELYRLKKFFLNDYFDILNQLYYNKLIEREQIIKISNQISITEHELRALQTYNNFLKDSISDIFKHIKLPYLKIRLDSLESEFSDIRKQHFYQARHIDLKYHWANDMKFSFFVNYNWTQTAVGTNNYQIMGVRFSTPLRANYKKQLMAVEKKIVSEELANKKTDQQNQLIAYFGNYRRKICDVIEYYKKWQLIEEKKRVVEVLKEELAHPYSGVKLLELANEQLDIMLKMLQLKKQLYGTLTHIYQYSPYSIDRYVQLLEIEEQFKTLNGSTVYLSRNTAHSFNLILKFLKAKGINKVLVSKTYSVANIKKLLRAGITVRGLKAEYFDIKEIKRHGYKPISAKKLTANTNPYLMLLTKQQLIYDIDYWIESELMLIKTNGQ